MAIIPVVGKLRQENCIEYKACGICPTPATMLMFFGVVLEAFKGVFFFCLCCFHRSEPPGATVRAHMHILGGLRRSQALPSDGSLGQCPWVSAHAWEVCTQRVLGLSLCLLLRILWKSVVTGSGKEDVCCFVVFSHLCWNVLSPFRLPPLRSCHL